MGRAKYAVRSTPEPKRPVRPVESASVKANAIAARNKSPRRRLIDPCTCERDYTDDDREFMLAMERYKRDNGRPFPTWSEALEVLKKLGYRKVTEGTR